MQTHLLIDTPKPVDTEMLVPPPTKAPPPIRVFRTLTWGIIAVALAALAIAVLPNFLEKPRANVVQASGRIEGRDVTLAAKEIQGRVKNLLVDEGFKVEQGQLLAELDSQQLDARL